MVRKGEMVFWLFFFTFFHSLLCRAAEVLNCMTVYANNGIDSQTSLLIFPGIITPGSTFSQDSYSD